MKMKTEGYSFPSRLMGWRVLFRFVGLGICPGSVAQMKMNIYNGFWAFIVWNAFRKYRWQKFIGVVDENHSLATRFYFGRVSSPTIHLIYYQPSSPFTGDISVSYVYLLLVLQTYYLHWSWSNGFYFLNNMWNLSPSNCIAALRNVSE